MGEVAEATPCCAGRRGTWPAAHQRDGPFAPSLGRKSRHDDGAQRVAPAEQAGTAHQGAAEGGYGQGGAEVVHGRWVGDESDDGFRTRTGSVTGLSTLSKR